MTLFRSPTVKTGHCEAHLPARHREAHLPARHREAHLPARHCEAYFAEAISGIAAR
jgi:hypothetical protein